MFGYRIRWRDAIAKCIFEILAGCFRSKLVEVQPSVPQPCQLQAHQTTNKYLPTTQLGISIQGLNVVAPSNLDFSENDRPAAVRLPIKALSLHPRRLYLCPADDERCPSSPRP